MLKSQSNTTNSAQQDALQAVVRCGSAITAFVKAKTACATKKEQLRDQLDLLQAAVDRLSAAGYRTPSTQNIMSVADRLLQSEIVASPLIVEIDGDFNAAKQLFNEARLHIQGRPKTDAMYEQVIRTSNRTERLANETRSKIDALLGRMTGAESIVRDALEALQRVEQRVAREDSRPSHQLSP